MRTFLLCMVVILAATALVGLVGDCDASDMNVSATLAPSQVTP